MSRVYQLAKQRVGYDTSRASRCCSGCAMVCRPWGPERLQCRVIGVCDDLDADVHPGAHCKAWKARLT